MIANFHVTAMCDDCQNALLGIVRQGFVCQRCKLICHPDCMEKISTPCRPSIKDRSRTILLDQHIVRVCSVFCFRKLKNFSLNHRFPKQVGLKKVGININY
jgi:hypothetical protein